ncbi:MAG: preprotein translocase subunit SecY [Candidatus Berkelbacteria bacterium]|nr:preprotein translocase subunit SecY [Candidatus Berkelbacteria bacterium]
MDTLAKIWQYRDLRNKVLVVAGLLILTRVISHIPLPGVNLEQLRAFFENNQIFGLLNMFSGGTMSSFSIALMGVGPYITSSIVFQLLTMIVPRLEEIQKEGEAGRNKINQWTRLLTVPLAIVQGYSMLFLLRSQGIIPTWTIYQLIIMLISITAGTLVLMWIGEIITEKGIGNGLSLIISIGILAKLPSSIRNTASLISVADTTKIIEMLIFVIITILIIGAIVLITEGQRNIPVSYARKSRNASSYSSINSFLPIKVNTAGVIPIIFAMSLMIIPGVVAKFFVSATTPWVAHAASVTENLFKNNLFYGALYFVLVVAFTYFYTSVVFKPDQIAENLQKQGGFVPGIRPGSETIHFLGNIIVRITLTSSIFLGLIAVLPYIMQAVTNVNTLVIGGTGILIVVSVVIETMNQLQAQLTMHTYENY